MSWCSSLCICYSDSLASGPTCSIALQLKPVSSPENFMRGRFLRTSLLVVVYHELFGSKECSLTSYDYFSENSPAVTVRDVPVSILLNRSRYRLPV